LVDDSTRGGDGLWLYWLSDRILLKSTITVMLSSAKEEIINFDALPLIA